MDNPISLITELFDLPGASQGRQISAAREKEGRDAKESEALGKECMGDGDYDGAIVHFRRAMEQGGTATAESLLNLGAAYEAGDYMPAAYRQYQLARKVQDSGELHAGLGAIYLRFGRVKEGIKQLEESIEMEPENAFFRFKLAEALRESGHRTAALAAVQTAVATAPDESFYHFWMGDLLLEMQRYEEAATALQASLELSPGDDHTLCLASIALWGNGKRPEAIRAIRLASDLDQDKMMYPALLVRYLLAEGMPEEAQLERKRGLKADRYDLDLIERLLTKAKIDLPADTISEE